jgi:hypothetical protein
VFTETSIPGNAPALGRLEIDNVSGNAQRKLWWGVQSREYDADATAELLFPAEQLEEVGATLAVGATGAAGAGNNVLKNTALTTTGDALAGIAAPGAALYFTHVGAFRVLARVYCPATNTGTVSLHVAWKSPRAADYIHNTAAEFDPALEGRWVWLDLGQVDIPRAQTGYSHQWYGLIYGASTVNGDDVEIDSVALVPVGEGDGEATGDDSNFPAVATGFLLTHEEALTVSPSTFAPAPPPVYEGAYLRVPSGTARFIVIVERELSLPSDFDGLEASLHVTPRYLVVPSG